MRGQAGKGDVAVPVNYSLKMSLYRRDKPGQVRFQLRTFIQSQHLKKAEELRLDRVPVSEGESLRNCLSSKNTSPEKDPSQKFTDSLQQPHSRLSLLPPFGKIAVELSTTSGEHLRRNLRFMKSRIFSGKDLIYNSA